MRKLAFVAAIAVAVIGAGGWARSMVATADLPMGHSVSIDIQALQGAAKDLPVLVIDDLI